jgi:uncharacterized phage infection (PIP) family protein YhgE
MPRTAPNVIASLADRLTNTRDRETYSALMCYLNRLPPGDEFRQLAELLGLLSLLGQRIPDALAEFLDEFRSKTKAEAEYCAKVESRLANLPKEIADGIDPAAVAKAMSESFRQQLAASGLQDTASLLKAAVITLKSLSDEVSTTLKPIAATFSDETKTLLASARQIEDEDAQLLQQQKVAKWVWASLVGIVMFLLGSVYGQVLEKQHTADCVDHIGFQLQRIETGLAELKKH